MVCGTEDGQDRHWRVLLDSYCENADRMQSAMDMTR